MMLTFTASGETRKANLNNSPTRAIKKNGEAGFP